MASFKTTGHILKDAVFFLMLHAIIVYLCNCKRVICTSKAYT